MSGYGVRGPEHHWSYHPPTGQTAPAPESWSRNFVNTAQTLISTKETEHGGSLFVWHKVVLQSAVTHRPPPGSTGYHSLSGERSSIPEDLRGHLARECVGDVCLCWRLEGCCSCRTSWLAGDSEGAGLVYLAHHTQYGPNTGHHKSSPPLQSAHSTCLLSPPALRTLTNTL